MSYNFYISRKYLQALLLINEYRRIYTLYM